MTIAYPKELKYYAEKLSFFGFDTVSLENASHYDALIFMHSDEENFLSSVHPTSEILFLDVTNITPENAADVFKRGLYSPLF